MELCGKPAFVIYLLRTNEMIDDGREHAPLTIAVVCGADELGTVHAADSSGASPGVRAIC
jgi:hypothetical protein